MTDRRDDRYYDDGSGRQDSQRSWQDRNMDQDRSGGRWQADRNSTSGGPLRYDEDMGYSRRDQDSWRSDDRSWQGSGQSQGGQSQQYGRGSMGQYGNQGGQYGNQGMSRQGYSNQNDDASSFRQGRNWDGSQNWVSSDRQGMAGQRGQFSQQGQYGQQDQYGQGRQSGQGQFSGRQGMGQDWNGDDFSQGYGRDQGYSRQVYSAGQGQFGQGQGSQGQGYQGQSYQGRGPKGYQRSDDRIKESINDALEDDHSVDASDIEVQVQGGEVTLTGTVTDRNQKRRAEDVAERLRGVRDVHNQLRVSQNSSDQAQSKTQNTQGTQTQGNQSTSSSSSQGSAPTPNISASSATKTSDDVTRR